MNYYSEEARKFDEGMPSNAEMMNAVQSESDVADFFAAFGEAETRVRLDCFSEDIKCHLTDAKPPFKSVEGCGGNFTIVDSAGNNATGFGSVRYIKYFSKEDADAQAAYWNDHPEMIDSRPATEWEFGMGCRNNPYEYKEEAA